MVSFIWGDHTRQAGYLSRGGPLEPPLAVFKWAQLRRRTAELATAGNKTGKIFCIPITVEIRPTIRAKRVGRKKNLSGGGSLNTALQQSIFADRDLNLGLGLETCYQ